MKEEAILIRYYSDACDEKILNECEEELHERDIKLLRIDLKGGIYCAALDFVDLDFIAISYLILQNAMASGSYDLFKYSILKLWASIRLHDIKEVPFTIRINGISTIKGPENISCKITGAVSEDQKNNIINKTFELANNISDNNMKLLEKSIFYSDFGHVFNINSETIEASEIDIEEEIRRKTK